MPCRIHFHVASHATGGWLYLFGIYQALFLCWSILGNFYFIWIFYYSCSVRTATKHILLLSVVFMFGGQSRANKMKFMRFTVECYPGEKPYTNKIHAGEGIKIRHVSISYIHDEQYAFAWRKKNYMESKFYVSFLCIERGKSPQKAVDTNVQQTWRKK